MERNVTSLDSVPGGLSKRSQAVAFSLSGLPPPCVWLYLEAGTTAVPHPCHPSRPPGSRINQLPTMPACARLLFDLCSARKPSFLRNFLYGTLLF